MIDDQRTDESAEVDEMMPVAAITREPGRLDAKHGSNRPVHTEATSFWNPGRAISPDPERPRSSSITVTDENPADWADSTSAYWRRWLSVFSITCPKVDWPT